MRVAIQTAAYGVLIYYDLLIFEAFSVRGLIPAVVIAHPVLRLAGIMHGP